MQTTTETIWNSLEIAKLLVAGLTPVLIAIVGLYLNRRLKRFEHMQWRNQKLIEKRLAIYDDLAPLLNDLLCYFTYVGNWKEIKPNEIVQLKRTIDKKFYVAAPLFSTVFFSETMTFINLCFKPYQGWGHNAKLMTAFERRKEAFGNSWDVSWEDLFTSDNQTTDPSKIKESYLKIMNVFSEDIGLNQANKLDKTGRIPSNIK
jgi:hypothetical protein